MLPLIPKRCGIGFQHLCQRWRSKGPQVSVLGNCWYLLQSGCSVSLIKTAISETVVCSFCWNQDSGLPYDLSPSLPSLVLQTSLNLATFSIQPHHGFYRVYSICHYGETWWVFRLPTQLNFASTVEHVVLSHSFHAKWGLRGLKRSNSGPFWPAVVHCHYSLRCNIFVLVSKPPCRMLSTQSSKQRVGHKPFYGFCSIYSILLHPSENSANTDMILAFSCPFLSIFFPNLPVH